MREIENEQMLQLAYITALWTSRFVWQKNPKSYEELTQNNKQKKENSVEQMLANIKLMNASMGGNIY